MQHIAEYSTNDFFHWCVHLFDDCLGFRGILLVSFLRLSIKHLFLTSTLRVQDHFSWTWEQSKNTHYLYFSNLSPDWVTSAITQGKEIKESWKSSKNVIFFLLWMARTHMFVGKKARACSAEISKWFTKLTSCKLKWKKFYVMSNIWKVICFEHCLLAVMWGCIWRKERRYDKMLTFRESWSRSFPTQHE